MENSSGGSDEMPSDRREGQSVAREPGPQSHENSSAHRSGSQRSDRSANEDESTQEGGEPAVGGPSSKHRADPSSVQSRREK